MKQKSTKIVATLGPASDTKEIIQKLYDNGMDVARLNFSHGAYEYFEKMIKNIRSVSDEIAILLDTKGPEIRSGEIKDGSCMLKDGQYLKLTKKEIIGSNEEVTINYNKLENIDIGNHLLIDDGLIETVVTEKNGDDIIVKVLNGGELGSKKTISVRGHNVDIPFLSKKDKEDIKFGIKNNLDFVAASFVRNVGEVKEIKDFLKKHGGEHIKLISKIEHGEAVDNIDEIILESDGIMVARGDLGVEIPLEKVPEVQKKIIDICNNLGKPVIVATQMLESMKDNPRPTRAEVGDVANAIIDGTDAIMLSGETASGKYPIKAVQAMTTIAKEYDGKININISEKYHRDEYLEKKSTSLYLTKAAFEASKVLKTSAILTPTETGFTARKVSRFKPKCPIIAAASKKTIIRQLQISWGVIPIFEEKRFKTLDGMVNDLIKKCYDKKLIKKGEKVVITAGHKLAKPGTTNILEVFRVNSILDRIEETK